ncbi:hypothetical protein AX16_007551 [Volvariella volvacea WC 439]|nr:hypothetical protein AX16_007551 [Volvariella volvacea WC 439]
MFLAGLLLAAIARALASPVPTSVPDRSIPSPLCAVAAAVTASTCDPTRTRTLFDILWSCIGVILLCTYISIHPNIPDQTDSWAKSTWMRVRTTLYALLAPEVVIIWAIRQRIMAGKIARRNQHRGWTRTHGFFVQMGGLMRRVGTGQRATYRVSCIRYDTHWETVKIPRIPEKEIRDRGKGDILSKAIVVIQTSWFVAQCIARHVQGLVLTEIELVTLAFATLNVITYGLWWEKPLNVEYPIYFDEEGKRVDGPEERGNEKAWYEEIWRCWKECLLAWKYSFRQCGSVKTFVHGIKAIFSAVFNPLEQMMGEPNDDDRVSSVHPFYAPWMDNFDRGLALFYGSVIGILFGGIHVIGWNFKFPTPVELWLWRASSLILTVIPFLLAVGSAFFVAEVRTESATSRKTYEIARLVFISPTAFIGAPLYFAARIVILVLAFFALRALPDSAYENVSWTGFLPHI